MLYTPDVLRAAFWCTALLFVPAGLLLYFLSASAATMLGIYPLWLARLSGGILLAWGAYQAAAALAPDPVKVGGLVAGNLLTVATLVPAVLKQGGGAIPGRLSAVFLALSLVLLLLSVLALLTYSRHVRPAALEESVPGESHG